MRLIMAALALLLVTACGSDSDDDTSGGDGHGIPTSPTPAQAEPLVGTTWKLVSTAKGTTSTPVPQGTSASLTVSDRGKVQVETGCNTGGGEVTVSDDRLEFGRMMTTLRACVDDGPRQTEQAFMEVVRGTVDYEIEGDHLTITRKNRSLGFTAS